MLNIKGAWQGVPKKSNECATVASGRACSCRFANNFYYYFYYYDYFTVTITPAHRGGDEPGDAPAGALALEVERHRVRKHRVIILLHVNASLSLQPIVFPTVQCTTSELQVKRLDFCTVRARVFWLSHTKMVSVITRGVSHEASSCCFPCPVIAFIECHTTRVGGRPNRVERKGVMTKPKCYSTIYATYP